MDSWPQPTSFGTMQFSCGSKFYSTFRIILAVHKRIPFYNSSTGQSMPIFFIHVCILSVAILNAPMTTDTIMDAQLPKPCELKISWLLSLLSFALSLYQKDPIDQKLTLLFLFYLPFYIRFVVLQCCFFVFCFICLHLKKSHYISFISDSMTF